MDLMEAVSRPPPPPPPPPPQHSSHPSFPIIAVAVIGILATGILLVSYYVFVIKCCLNWHRIDLLRRFSFSRRRRAEEPLVAHSPAVENRGLNEAQIRSIPIFKFKNGEIDSKSMECAVCLNEFREEEKLRVIPICGHIFHIDCIDIWLQNNANCPLCRTSISATRPDIHLTMDRPDQDPGPSDNFIGREEDYVVIEIGSEHVRTDHMPRIPESSNSGELVSISPSPRKAETKGSRKKSKKFGRVSSMGDEFIGMSRKKDEQFVVQPMRRSFSMDSAADANLYLAVQEILQQVNNEVCPNEGCSSSNNRVKRSFFSFGSRSAVQPVGTEP